ncbi:unnamed protein product [Closterium sp. Naga37s-1]|nr:unnamed protein product [Closterium sp. Naga37s-1]
MLNRPPALATSAGGANAAHRRKRSINRKGTGTLSLPLLSPSAASFGALPGAASPAGGAAALAQGSPMAGGGSGNPMTPMSPMFYSSLLPPASPSVLHLALQIDLPRDHVDALKAVLQVIGNFANAGELHQTAVWDRCFPGTFSRLATVRSPAVQRPLCMVLFTCCRAVPKHVDGLGGSMDGVALLAGALRAQGEALVARAEGRDGGSGGAVFSALPDAASNGMDEWLGLLIERLCLRARYFEPVFKNLPNFSPRPALGQVRGLFCPEQAALLWVLWGALHATAKARGIPVIDLPSASNEDDGNSKGDNASEEPAAPGSRWQVHGLPDIGPGTLKFLLTACRNAAVGLGKAREEAGSKALTSSSTSFTCLQLVLCFSLRCLRVLAAQEPSTTSHPVASDATPAETSAAAGGGQAADSKSTAEDAFVAIGGSEIIPMLLDLLQGVSLPGGSSGQSKEEAYPGYRSDLVSVLANACHRRPAYQDAVRMYKCTGERTDGDVSGLVLVLRQIIAEPGGGSGGIKEWVGYAARCLVEGNESNRRELAAAVQAGSVSRETLEAAGVKPSGQGTRGRSQGYTARARARKEKGESGGAVQADGEAGEAAAVPVLEGLSTRVRDSKISGMGQPWDAGLESLPSLPPFTAGAFESHVNRHASRLPVPVFRSYDTGLPETLFDALEGMATEGGAGNIRYKGRSRYHIWIADTELDIEYKLICVPNPDNSGIILTKVKHNSVRYAVIDIARPSSAIDFRLLLRQGFVPSMCVCPLALMRSFPSSLHYIPFSPHIPISAHIPPLHISPLHIPPLHISPLHIPPFHIPPLHIPPLHIRPLTYLLLTSLLPFLSPIPFSTPLLSTRTPLDLPDATQSACESVASTAGIDRRRHPVLQAGITALAWPCTSTGSPPPPSHLPPFCFPQDATRSSRQASQPWPGHAPPLVPLLPPLTFPRSAFPRTPPGPPGRHHSPGLAMHLHSTGFDLTLPLLCPLHPSSGCHSICL